MQAPTTLEMKTKSALIGSVVHSISFGEVEIINNGMIVYSNTGKIEQLLDLDKTPLDKATLTQYKSVKDYTGKLIMPGFVDAHCHAPQYVFSGTGMDLPLLAWLEKYTFPCEARFADEQFARVAYEKSIRRHLKSGTTFAAYFATIHNSGGKVLVDVINRVGQRAFVGKVSMDRNSPDFYIEETTRGCEDAEEFARYVLSMTPVGATFLRSVDLKATLSAATLLEQSRNARSVGGRPSLTGGMGNTLLTNAAAAASASLPGSSLKRPRSVSTGDEADLNGHTRPHTVSFSAGSSSSTTTPARPVRDISGDMPVITPGSADTFTTARARTISASDMDLYGNFEEDEFYESGQFDPADYAVASAGGASSSSSSTDEPLKNLLNQPFTPLVLPCVTPRFVPTCTGEMLARLAEIATKYGLPVQSHLSESVGEIAWVKELHPDCANYASVYQKYGLLHENCIMAHCCHSDNVERQLLADTRTSIVHCASSNFNLDSGVLDVHGCVAQGIRVGLGTDVAGGYSPSMLDALRQSIIASKVILFESRGDLRSSTSMPAAASDAAATSSSETDSSGASSEDGTPTVTVTTAPVVTKVRPLSYKEAYHLATMGSAEALGMDKVVGNFVPGKKLDCLIVDPAVPNGPFDLFEGEGVSEFFQKFLFLGDDRNIVSVYVDGRQVL